MLLIHHFLQLFEYSQRDTIAAFKNPRNLWHDLWHGKRKVPEILSISGTLVESGGLEPSTFRV